LVGWPDGLSAAAELVGEPGGFSVAADCARAEAGTAEINAASAGNHRESTLRFIISKGGATICADIFILLFCQNTSQSCRHWL
jgi:hypothetical protein